MPIIAIKTVQAIDAQMTSDQGNRFRSFLKQLILEAEEPFKQENDSHRSHLGVSSIGRPCARALYYNFRWVKKSQFPGRIMRLFNRGHLEEPRIVASLMAINCQLWTQDAEGNQFRLSDFGGHFGSAIDAVVRGIPDAPENNLLGEFKTHNDKSFKKLAGANWVAYTENPAGEKFTGEGVKATKFEHYVQMQVYMKKLNLWGAIYIACNKNDDSFYAELVEYDAAVADRYIERGGKIVFATKPPAKLHNNPAMFDCKYCDYLGVCHKGEPVELNCRTCKELIPQPDGSWKCVKFDRIKSKSEQLIGCDAWDPINEFRP